MMNSSRQTEGARTYLLRAQQAGVTHVRATKFAAELNITPSDADQICDVLIRDGLLRRSGAVRWSDDPEDFTKLTSATADGQWAEAAELSRQRGISFDPTKSTLPRIDISYAILSSGSCQKFQTIVPTASDKANEGELERGNRQVVLLVHGIRTHADWQSSIKPVLEQSSQTTEVIAIKYGWFSSVGLLVPLLRRSAIGKVRWRILSAIEQNENAEISIVAHSFGTYAVSTILRQRRSLRIKHLVLCGCILPVEHRWDQYREQISGRIINEVGVRDFWPIAAVWSTVGYGPSGTNGFGTPGVIDRTHDLSHSEYLTPTFAKNYWLPLLQCGEVKTPSPFKVERSLLWSLLTVFRLPYILLAAVAAAGIYIFVAVLI